MKCPNDHAAAEQILETDCPVYSLTIGDDQTEIPLTAYDRPYNIIRRREVEIPDELVSTENTYQIQHYLTKRARTTNM